MTYLGKGWVLKGIWPYSDLIQTLLWKKKSFARYLTLFWHYFSLILEKVEFCTVFDLILTLVLLYLNLILTLFWKIVVLQGIGPYCGFILTLLEPYFAIVLEKVGFCKVFIWPHFDIILETVVLTLFWKKCGFARY